MSAQVQPQQLSSERYLELDRAAISRSEYYKGRMFAMSGGTYAHACAIANLTGELHAALKKTPCQVLSNDMRIRLAPDGLYTYPDIAVVCGEPRFADEQRDTLLNPALIIEVLSPSTEACDRGFKAAQYRSLPSLEEYGLVSQAEPRIEVFRRQVGGDWLLVEYAGRQAIGRFASVNCEVALADVYYRIDFSETDPLSARPTY
jgi:Uma2 family endonuclease